MFKTLAVLVVLFTWFTASPSIQAQEQKCDPRPLVLIGKVGSFATLASTGEIYQLEIRLLVDEIVTITHLVYPSPESVSAEEIGKLVSNYSYEFTVTDRDCLHEQYDRIIRVIAFTNGGQIDVTKKIVPSGVSAGNKR